MAVLSIQSHVVSGYAGNTAAVFPMQRLGHEVWAVNTVEFSNHTGYGAYRGKTLGADFVRELVQGLDERGILPRCEAVLSGYLGDAENGKAIARAVKMSRNRNSGVLYCCDPVMGDTDTGIYVKSDIPAIFKNELCPLADIVTPNRFELETLTGIAPDTTDTTRRAIDALHNAGPRIVLVTSFLEDGARPAANGQISMLASDGSGVYKISTPCLPLDFRVAGSGDMTAAVFLSRFLETRDCKRTLELCAASVFGILEKSFPLDNSREKTAMPELRIVEAQEELVNPSHEFRAVKI